MNSAAARLLARVMSGLSEDYFCAGWLGDCEYALWADLTGYEEIAGVKAWGITQEEKDELRLAHEVAGGWIVWGEGGETYLSNKDWQEHLKQKTPRSAR